MTQHTPGPWDRRNMGTPTGPSARHEVTGNGRIICRMGGLTKEDYANARLIAAAPEMYEFVKLIAATPTTFGVDRRVPRCVTMARALLARIEGR